MTSRSGATWIVDTPAKINLYLEVLAKREDGFHEIETLMAAVDLYDRLYVTNFERGRTQVTCRWASGIEAQSRSREGTASESTLEALPRDSDNIIWKAVERLRLQTGVTAGICIQVVKRIPAAAGLGGASSDAAAALVAANAWWRLDWSPARLSTVAAEIGSDVPFFLNAHYEGAGMAICRGRGERIETQSTCPTLHLVLVKPPAGLATPAVYRRVVVPREPRSLQPALAALRTSDWRGLGSRLFNRLQVAAAEISPWIERLRAWFGNTDCIGHQMSGSGSSYFAVCRNARHARRLAKYTRAAGYGLVFALRTGAHARQLAG